MNANVASLFFDAAARNPAGAAFLAAGGGRVTFTELRDRVERTAAGFAGLGIGPGDRMLFMLPMSVELYVAVLGCLTAGAVAVFVDPWVSLRRIVSLAGAARAKAFVGSPAAHVLRLSARELRDIEVTITTGAVARPFARHRLAALARGAGTATPVHVANSAPALITFTTGSSGDAKGVNRTHAILRAQHDVIREEFPARPDDVDLTTFPVFALSNLAAGIATVIPPVNLRRVASAKGTRVLAAVQEHGVTTMAASPPLFDVLASHAAANRVGAPAPRRIVTGGAPVVDEQLRRWRQVWPHAEIVVAYGSSEAEPVASISVDERLASRGAGFCVGAPVHAVRTRLIPITSAPVTTLGQLGSGERIGELVVAGPHVCRDYVADDRAFAETKVRDAEGTIWHRMGDTGYFDEAGRFWLAGRVHSTIRRGGALIHPQIVEQLARADDARIRRAAAVGVPDATLGERLVVVIESDRGAVMPDVRERLARSGVAPVDALYVTKRPLPVDPRHNSKVDYRRLRELLARKAIR